MIHRHLDYPADTPPDRLGQAAIDDVLDRGDLDDWAPLARTVAAEPWGSLAHTILHLCAAHPMYGTSRLWGAYVATCRATALGGGTASWPLQPGAASLAQLRAAQGLSQAAVGERVGMNQSEVSRLERRADLRLSSLRSYVAAIGGRLHLRVAWPRGRAEVEVVIGDSGRTEPARDHR
jgi:Helix-turn-helix domain